MIKPYETDENEKCLTRCDHIPLANVNGTKNKNHVGSFWCRHRCPNCKGYDIEAQTVNCGAEK